jgi:hypothetical protein
VLPDPLALLSAFCAAGREILVADDELRAEKERFCKQENQKKRVNEADMAGPGNNPVQVFRT